MKYKIEHKENTSFYIDGEKVKHLNSIYLECHVQNGVSIEYYTNTHPYAVKGINKYKVDIKKLRIDNEDIEFDIQFREFTIKGESLYKFLATFNEIPIGRIQKFTFRCESDEDVPTISFEIIPARIEEEVLDCF